MTELFLVLLRILFPLDPVARLREITRKYLDWLVTCLEDPRKQYDFLANPEACAGVEAHVIVIEHGIQLLINERARQIAGLPFVYTDRLKSVRVKGTKTPRQVLARLNRAAALFHDLERLAQRRAERMQRERCTSPLRLAATLQSTSPMLRMAEDSVSLLGVLPRRRRGRWIARTCAQDGGGCAFPRGPPHPPASDFRNPNLAGPARENAPSRPTATRRMDFRPRFWSIAPTPRTTPKRDEIRI